MHAARTHPRLHEITVAEVMSRKPVTIAPEATLRDLLTLLADTGVNGVPVVDGDEVVGVVSARDLIDFESEAAPGGGGWEEGEEEEAWAGEEEGGTLAFYGEGDVHAAPDPLAAQTVGEVMTRALVTVPAHALLREAAERMQGAAVHRLLVLEDGRLAGIVTTTDVVRALARYG